MRGSNQDWYIDNGCLRNMTRKKKYFLSLIVFQGGSVNFGNNKKGEITGIGKIGKLPSQAIKNVYCVNGLNYNLLSVLSQV